MNNNIQLSEFTPDRWQFLADLEACGMPIPIHVSKTLTSVDSILFDNLIEQCMAQGWIQLTKNKQIKLTQALPETVRYELQLLNTPDRISLLLHKIQTKGLAEQLDKLVLIKLLLNTGKGLDASEMEIKLAHEILSNGDHNLAYRYFGRAVGRLNHHITNGGKGGETLFLKSVLEFSNLSFAVGKGMRLLLNYLQTAVELAESFGDERFYALGNLHLGRLEAYFGNLSRGDKFLFIGKEKVETLGDTDILKAAAEFLGLYYMNHEHFDEAIKHFERAEQNFIQNEDQLLFYPVILWQMGICLFTTGQVTRALGLLKNYWFLADTNGWPGIAHITRAVLGLFLAVMQKRDDAEFHLNAAIKDALADNNAYALLIARAGQVNLYGENKIEQFYKLLKKAFEKETSTSPFGAIISFMDLLFEFDHPGFEPITSVILNYEEKIKHELIDRNESKISKALLLRRKLEQRLQNGESTSRVKTDIENSRKQLELAGLDYTLTITMISLARIYLREGKLEKAKALAFDIHLKAEAMHLGSGWLPPDIRNLLDNKKAAADSAVNFHIETERYLSLLHELDHPDDEDSLLYGTISKMLSVLGAGRGALFCKKSGNATKSLLFLSGCNLTRKETESKRFIPSMTQVEKALDENQIIIKHLRPAQKANDWSKARTILMLPLYADGKVQGVAYFENSFIEDVFDNIPLPFLATISRHITRYVRILQKMVRMRSENDRLRLYNSNQVVISEKETIITRDEKMSKVLTQAQKAALSEATLLITGETGTGKELMVRRVHKMSKQSKGPFITVDATTIPENLVESELFGHEKGSFTGAGQLKKGRIELAHEGTLFIDEIGELPLSAQAKLLRALETRKFYRVGGTQLIKSDFRLVAATHRNLAREVVGGRFRQDLYYRLNIISCELPPLRERGLDIILLANHFLERYCNQYGFSQMQFTPEDKSRMSAYPWPGNVRELKNAIERSVILSSNSTPALDLPNTSRTSDAEVFMDMPDMEEMQRRYIQKVLLKANGRIKGPNGACAILGMKRSTLYSRMYKLGIRTVKNKT